MLQMCSRPVSPQRLSQSYTPVNGWREALPRDASQDPADPPLPPVWDWSLQYSCNRRARFTHPVSQPAPPQLVLNGNLNANPDSHKVSCSLTVSPWWFTSGTGSSYAGGGGGRCCRPLPCLSPLISHAHPDHFACELDRNITTQKWLSAAVYITEWG